MSDSLVNDMLFAASSGEEQVLIRNLEFRTDRRNELLFFFKPECFLLEDKEKISTIVEMCLGKFEEYEVDVSGALLLSGNRLGELEITDRHYGYINRLSRAASHLITAADVKQIGQSLGIADMSVYRILGGHEFLKAFPAFNPDSLNSLWFTKKSVKLRSGFYVQQYKVDGSKIILVNGFHPLQLHHYTASSHEIIVLLLHSDSDWQILRNDMVGDTYPERALPTSIRGELYRNKDKYGAVDVSIANNFVHLSAGPFEGLFEIYNFFNNIACLSFQLTDTNFGRAMLNHGLREKEIMRAISNPTAQVDSGTRELFSATENMNTDEALSYYIKHFLASSEAANDV